jgi:hypothetical protein
VPSPPKPPSPPPDRAPPPRGAPKPPPAAEPARKKDAAPAPGPNPPQGPPKGPPQGPPKGPSSGPPKGPPPRASVDPAAALRARISAAAQRFSVPALLDLLHAMGYRDEEIEFRSHQSQSPQHHLVQRIEFLEEGDPLDPYSARAVVITVNLGLLAAQTPLPAYVMKILDQQDASGMEEFLWFFDHALLRDRFQALYPERNRGLFLDWEETKSKLLRMLGLESPSTMYWLFRRVYPELGLVVRRGQQQMPLSALGATLGEAILGDRYTLGGIAQVPVGGMEITLCAEEPQSPAGMPWAQEASRRLIEQILPLLRGVDLQLSVFMLFIEHSDWVRLVPDQYLGFEPLRPTESPQQPRPQLVQLWSGDARAIQ